MRAACEVGLLVMREVSLVGVSQAEAGYNSNSNSNVQRAVPRRPPFALRL